MDVLEDEASEDLYRLSGATASAEAPGAQMLVRLASFRLPALVLLLGCGALAAWLMHRLMHGQAQTLGPQFVVACFLPVFVMVAGNAGTQSVSASVSGLAAGELRGASLLYALGRELRAALLIALICGLMMYLIGEIWSGAPRFALAVGLAVWFSLLAAGLLGSLLPVACGRWGADPAVAAGPLVSGLSDLSSVAIYVALTSTLARYWVR
jgi:magnesium transporter